MKNIQAIAHIRKSNGEKQTVETHLFAVASIAKRLASKLGLSSAGELIGLMHDFGKYSAAFQTYIQSSTGLIEPDSDDFVDPVAKKGKIDHSSAGAQWVYKALSEYGQTKQIGELCGQILALCIASHHSGMIDSLSIEGDNKFKTRIKKSDELTHLEECALKADHSVLDKAKEIASEPLVRELDGLIKKITQAVNHGAADSATVQEFNLGYLTRFYSVA